MLPKKWWFILLYFLFWMALFAAHRLLFIILYYSRFASDSFLSIASNFFHALYLDTSAACYIMALPVVLLGLAYIFQLDRFLKILNVYTILMIFVYGFIALGEDGIYGEWNTKLNYQALWHFRHINEVLNTISTSLIISFFVASAVIGGLFTWWYWKKIRLQELYSELKYPFLRYVLGILFLGVYSILVFVGIRGGWQPIPITQSVAYYSSNPVLNDAAVNPAWNLFSNFYENYLNLDKNPFEVMPYAEAHQLVDELYDTPKDSTTHVLTTTTPNICIILLESWSADLVGSCGGIQGVTPEFDSLAQYGILFKNMISSAMLSDQGVTAVLSGHPHTYRLFLCRQPEKSKKVGSISKILHDAGYSTGFFYGGQLTYGNIKSYLFNHEYDVMKEESDYDPALPRARLGIHDHVMALQFARSLGTARQPFLYNWFTISSHMPYDFPAAHDFDYLKPEGQYASSVHYTDSSLGLFFREVRNTAWYKNTLFVLVADHSHVSPTFRLYQSAAFHHIPCLFFGEVIKKEYRGRVMDKTCMQADIAATLMKQCGKSTETLPWSRDLFNPYTKPWAFYVMHEGGAFVNDTNYVGFNTIKNSFFVTNSTDSATIKKNRKYGEAMQQVLFDEFLKF